MRLLLDTHAMFWYLEGDPQLSSNARTLIQDAPNQVLMSPASYWEMAIKISIGRWHLNRTYEEFIDLALNRYGFQILPVLPAHTAALIALPFHHRDPFGRLLIAQAVVEKIPVLSADQVLDAYPVQRLW